ncbi:hypothetical protein [Roseateles amylovorans]|uniref:Uncharacterized protein n=1 Tax=Roseateles amylovorans TaxID=2978473 RepID=A0ABY6AVI3_9BURK|nr:hypothetical protein [Roseateles amylovorans]UXH76943.1 hypothetical protein N4261_18180 [Roseateles amylovorans]
MSTAEERTMHFAEIDTGDYRIYAGAIERPRQFGYVAAVVVMSTDQAIAKREAFRDENLAGGYGWATPAEALRFAINAGKEAVMCRIGMRA